jgi:hypothetical protein
MFRTLRLRDCHSRSSNLHGNAEVKTEISEQETAVKRQVTYKKTVECFKIPESREV